MNFQDLTNINTVMNELSVSKAAAKLYISQPSLSKCIKRVEQEYGITLFYRSKGSALTLTEEGGIFREMAQSVLQSHEHFEHQLEHLHNRSNYNIVFAATRQRAYDIAGPIMKWIYDHNPGYYMEVRTYPSRALIEELVSCNIDMALMTSYTEDTRLFATQVAQSKAYIYLRKGSPVGERAYTVPGSKFKVLPIQELENELFVDNVQGTGGRNVLETIMRKTGVQLSITEQPVHSLRVAMVDAGYATMITSTDALSHLNQIDLSRVYALPEEQEHVSNSYLVCRKDFCHNSKYEIMLKALREYYTDRKL